MKILPAIKETCTDPEEGKPTDLALINILLVHCV